MNGGIHWGGGGTGLCREGLVSVERGSCATQMNKKLHQKVIPCAYPTVQVE